MHVGERGILASLLLILLAFSTSTLTRLFQGAGTSGPLSWQWYLGLYLPFALFTLVSTYHFLDWAKKHRRQAFAVLLLLFGTAILLGLSATNGPRPEIGSLSSIRLTFSEQSQIAQNPSYAFPQIQQGVLKMQEALNSTPYYSSGANVLFVLTTFAAIAIWLIRTRRRPGPALMAQKQSSIEDLGRAPANTPREAIIRYYSLVCKSLLERGTQISDSDTATDIYAKALTQRPTIALSLRRLTSLFQEAKFSLHPITDREANEASTEWSLITTKMAKEISG